MARIAGVDLPREKRIEIGLTYIYGIGRVSSNRILAEANIDPNTRVKDLTDEEKVFLLEDRRQRQTLELVRVLRKQSQTRKNNTR